MQDYWKILLDHPLSYALTDTTDVPAMYLQQFWKIVIKMPDIEDTIIFKLDKKPFVAPVNIEIIKSFMNRVDYHGMVDKWDFMNYESQKKGVIQYPRFTKLIISYLMKKFSNIPQMINEDYHSIKDDISLVSIYTTRNVLVRGMLILDEILTKEIYATNDCKEYEMVFINVVVLINQPQPIVSTQGTHRSTHSSHMTPTLTTASNQGKKRKQSVTESSSPQKLLKITIRQKQVSKGAKDEQSYDDADDSMIDEKEGNEMGSLEIRTEKMQTPIPTTPRSPRINLSSNKNIVLELTNTISLLTPTTSKAPHMQRHISSKYSHLPGALLKMCRRQGYKIKNTKQKDDAFHSQHHDDHQDSDAPPEEEKRVKSQKTSKSSKSVKETIINEDEVIPEDETPKLIIEFQNIDKRVLTIFDRASMEATLNDMLSNQFKNVKEYA
nr:hypothetical protein [Tanacetum cinerariifolium]